MICKSEVEHGGPPTPTPTTTTGTRKIIMIDGPGRFSLEQAGEFARIDNWSSFIKSFGRLTLIR